MRKSLLSTAILGFLFTGIVSAQKKGAIVDPAEAGEDYALQGEYAGEVDGMKMGARVIALGKGTFACVAYPGGLPGDGWDKAEKFRMEGKAEDGGISFSHERHKGVLKDGVIVVNDVDGPKVGELKRVERKSSTLGEKPPEGAVVLFDGTSVDGWKGGKMTGDGLLMEGTTSEKRFGSFKLHIEFRLPFQPEARGQARGNSGVYMQGRYEVQVLDSFGLEGQHNECGGIYSVKAPDENMCYPPLVWQTYDVEFTAAKFDGEKKTENARMTVRHNGVLIHDNVEVPKSTTAAPVKEGAEPGPIYLQNHGNPVRYRNIWVVPVDG